MKIFFKKSKKPYFGSMGAILAFFAQIWAKMDFPGKKRLYQFLNIPIIYHRAKKKKKMLLPKKMPSWRMDGQTDLRTVRQL